MMTFQPTLVALLALATLVMTIAPARAGTNGFEALADGNTSFALDLYGRLKGKEGNLFLSPYSISTCLAMTFAGARGNTEREMTRALHFDIEAAAVHRAFAELQRELNGL